MFTVDKNILCRNIFARTKLIQVLQLLTSSIFMLIFPCFLVCNFNEKPFQNKVPTTAHEQQILFVFPFSLFNFNNTLLIVNLQARTPDLF